jgi:chromosome segregation ATPase
VGPPPKPEINLYKSKINPIPKTINSVQRPPKDTQSKSKILEVDNQTTATCNTAWSSDNEISDLQSTSRNQMSANHKIRMKQLELILQNSIEDYLEQITNVSHKIQQIEKSNNFLQEEMETIMNTLPRLSTSLQSQNNQLQRTIEDNTDFCRITSESISALQTLQNSTDNKLDHIHSILNKLVYSFEFRKK